MTTTPQTDLPQLLASLQAWLAQYPSLLVAYSGGVDSALLMAVAHRTLGQKALACIGVSPSYPEREYKAALDLAHSLGANVRLVNTEEHLDPRYAANPNNRCYFCKSELFSKLKSIAQAENFPLIIDGNNASDASDDRPGSLAAREKGVRSPLAELHITKELVRALALHLHLPVWDKPSMPCTSSRVPHGTPIVPALLRQIEHAESALLALGFSEFRVRHHHDIARLELSPKDFPKALELRTQITAALKPLGYKFITLDLTPFHSGSLHTLTQL